MAALVASACVWWAAPRPDDAVESVDCSTLEADDFGRANALAVACDEQVEVTAERTPWQTSWAGPDGVASLEISAVPVRANVDGRWVPIDSALVAGEDAIHVEAPALPMTINPGGPAGAGKPLGSIERDGHVLDVWFPLDLPAATIDGSHVIYPLAEGVRLIVTVNVDTTGFVPVVELADSEAAARFQAMLESHRSATGTPGAGIDLDFGVRVSEGLTLSVDGERQLLAVDPEGETQFFAPPPTMWDSAGETVAYGPDVEVASTDRSIQPSGGDAVAYMGVALNGDTLVVTPDAGMLTSEATVWPIYLDPSFGGGAALRIATRTGDYTNTLVNWTDVSSSMPGQGVGYCNVVSSCTHVFKQRLIWRFNGLSTIANLAGTDITSASFTVNGVHSYNCTAQTTTLYRTADITTTSNWSLSWTQALGSRTESQRSSCGTNGYRSFDAKAGFVWIADNNASTISLGLYSAESSMATWKRFAYDATITVNYNRAPDVPTSQQLTEPLVTGCVTGAARPAISDATPTLSAIVSDPDASNPQPSFEVAPVTALTAPVWSSGNLTGVATNTRASATVQAGKLTSGTAYAWRARAYDGSRYGSWSGWCEFLVDTVAPNVPTVNAVLTGVPAVYRENAESGGVGLPGSFTVNDNGSTDVVSFVYELSGTGGTVTPDGAGSATISPEITSPGLKTLKVKSVDAAGNESGWRTYVFTVATPTEDGIWMLDEGTGATAQDTGGTPPRPLTVSGATWTDGPHTLFGSREGDYALEFDGVDDYASTGVPVLDTRKSFAVSAHVLLDPAKVGGSQSMTAFSQDGVDRSGFRVEYRATCPGMTSGCWAFVMADAASGTSETVAYSSVPVTGGEWTLLLAQYTATTNTMQLWVCEAGTPADPAVGDPVATGLVTRTATPWQASAGLQLGRSRVAGEYSGYWDGSIDNVRVFSGQVVSDGKIRRLCQGAEATDFAQGDSALDPTTTVGG